ncbi:hypothetical protein [Aeromonas sanarellii]|uniref:hypothetical protein n=1 Tax=Aeromonas sanarellii TaxID=633415 RepID=UPI003BA0DDBB
MANHRTTLQKAYRLGITTLSACDQFLQDPQNFGCSQLAPLQALAALENGYITEGHGPQTEQG